MATSEVHDLEPQEFLEEVHSFDFWFQAVEGYLSGQSYGHRPETQEAQPTSPWPWVAGGVAILALVGGAYALGRGQTPARPARRPTMALARA
jgi:hypothetical protein